MFRHISAQRGYTVLTDRPKKSMSKKMIFKPVIRKKETFAREKRISGTIIEKKFTTDLVFAGWAFLAQIPLAEAVLGKEHTHIHLILQDYWIFFAGLGDFCIGVIGLGQGVILANDHAQIALGLGYEILANPGHIGSSCVALHSGIVCA
jgi:hypothetical protein